MSESKGVMHLFVALAVSLTAMACPVWADDAAACEKSEYRFCFQERQDFDLVIRNNANAWSRLETTKEKMGKAAGERERAALAEQALLPIRAEMARIAAEGGSPLTLTGAVAAMDRTLGGYALVAGGASATTIDEIGAGYWDASAQPGRAARDWLGASGCATAKPRADAGNCDKVYRSAVAFGDMTSLARSLVIAFHQPGGDDNVALATQIRQQWHAEIYDTNFSYPWEMYAERWIEQKLGLAEEEKDRDGNPLGLRRPRTHKMIFLHPDAGLQFLSHQKKGERIAPAITLELLGCMQWGYRGGAVSGLRGYSIVTSFADRPNVSSVGYGLMFHVRQYAFAITAHDDDVAITFNLRIGDRLGKISKATEDEIQRPRKQAEAAQ